MTATMNSANDGGYQPYCKEHGWTDQVYYDFGLACEAVDDHNRLEHGEVEGVE